MVVEKLVPDVYGQHAFIDEVVRPFLHTPGNLIVSEYAESVDWWFSLNRSDGTRVRRVLSRMNWLLPRDELAGLIRDGVNRMLNA